METESVENGNRRWLIFAVLATGTFMSTMTSSIVNVALPLIMQSLASDIVTVQWVISAYLLTIISLLPLAGRLGDMYGRRRMYSLGFLGFISGSLLCGLAQSVFILIAARIVQALGAAVLMANGTALVTEIFAFRERGKALGILGTAVALGSMTGPSLGGLLAGIFGWHAIFFINLPVGLAGYVGCRLFLPVDKEKRKKEKSIDYPGVVLFSLAMISLLLVLSQGTSWGWYSVHSLAGIAAAFLLFTLFLRQEKRARQPMVDLIIFRNKAFVYGNIAGFLSFVAIFANTVLMPFYLQDVQHLPPFAMGLVMSAFPVVMAIVAPISGALSDRIGPRVLTGGGMLLTTAGLVYLAGLDYAASIDSVVLGQAVLGLGNGLFQSPNNNSVMSALPPAQAGVAGGINALARNLGMVSGTAVAVAIFTYQRLQEITELPLSAGTVLLDNAWLRGFHDAMLAAALFAGISFVITLFRGGYTTEED